MPEVISRSLNLEKPVGVVGAVALKRDRAEPTSEPADVQHDVTDHSRKQRVLTYCARVRVTVTVPSVQEGRQLTPCGCAVYAA